MRGLAIAVGAAAVLVGCGNPQPGTSPMRGEPGRSEAPWGPEELLDDSPTWPFWPRRMRVHPLTRLAHEARTGTLFIEARIEFQDEAGHTTKAVGQVRLDLHDAERRGGQATPLSTWSRDLRDRAVNDRHYDEVVRTYLFRLEVDEPTLPQEPELRVYFLGADGQRLRETFRLRR
jgi:hypothetical protein